MKRIYNHLAENIKTILFTLVMLLLIFSFGMWGVADVVKSMLSSQSSAVKIDGKKISNQTIDNNFRNFINIIGNQNNTTISIEDGVQAGLLEASATNLVKEIALDQEASTMGIEINNELIAKDIRKDKYFQDEHGSFDAEKFATVIAASGYRSEKQFIDAIKQEKARLNLLNILKAGAQPSNDITAMMKKYDSEVRTAKYVKIPFDKSTVDASEDNLKAYYETNKDKYRTPELKDISVLSITKEAIDSTDLSETEIEDELLEIVDLVDTLLADEVTLDDISSEVGIDLVAIPAIDPKNTAKFTNTEEAPVNGIREVLGAVLEMSFSDEGNISALKETTDGEYFVVRIDATSGNEPKEFANVKEEITSKYIEEQAKETTNNMGVELVKQINAGEETLENISKENKLNIETSMQFHRLPKGEELKAMSPIAIAQLFTKENVGEAGISILSDSALIFVLEDISYEDTDNENIRTETPEMRKYTQESLIMEGFTDSLLNKYNTEINYNALDKIYDIEQDTSN